MRSGHPPPATSPLRAAKCRGRSCGRARGARSHRTTQKHPALRGADRGQEMSDLAQATSTRPPWPFANGIGEAALADASPIHHRKEPWTRTRHLKNNFSRFSPSSWRACSPRLFADRAGSADHGSQTTTAHRPCGGHSSRSSCQRSSSYRSSRPRSSSNDRVAVITPRHDVVRPRRNDPLRRGTRRSRDDRHRPPRRRRPDRGPTADVLVGGVAGEPALSRSEVAASAKDRL